MRLLNNKNLIKNERHPYHVVDCSPWPIVMSLSIFSLVTSCILFLHQSNNVTNTLSYSSFNDFLFTFVCMCVPLYYWLKDIVIESTFEGNHTRMMRKNIYLGMSLFIISEALFFFSFFWAFFHFSLAPSVYIGNIWPPKGLELIPGWGFAAVGTMCLVVSGISLTQGYKALVKRDRGESLYGLFFSIIFGVIFTYLQYFEYTQSTFSINDSVYGSIFFVFTGFHGLHVLIGTIFLFVCFIRHCFYHFTNKHHVGLECAAWYWHFVDIVWILLYLCLYKMNWMYI